MTDPGRHYARRADRPPRVAEVAGRALLVVATLLVLFGAAAAAPDAAAGPRAKAARNEAARATAVRNEASRNAEKRKERRNAAAPRRPIDRADGPRGGAATGARAPAERPIRIAIPEIGVESLIEVLTTVGNRMQDPTGPNVVAWYDDSDDLGADGNAVFAGHLDYADAGPAVFADLNELAKNDRILVTDDDGDVHAYRVVARRIVSATAGPWDELTASTDRPTLTLITCAGPWDAALGHYRDRLVVRAVWVGS